MSWVTLTLLGTATLGASNIIDSHLLTKRMSFRVFLMLLAAIIVVYSVILCYLFPLPSGVEIGVLLITVIQGVLRSIGVAVMLYVFRMEEVSRAVPVIYIYPIFVAIMAVPLLGESLAILDWSAIVIVVAGAVMISVRRRLSGGFILSKPFWLLLVSAVLFAFSDIAGKYVLSTISFFNLYWLSAFAMCGIFFIVSVRPATFRELKDIKRKDSAIGLLVLDETISVAGVILGFWALQLGPVALVSTVNSTRPMFVVLFSLILSLIAPAFVEFAPGRGLLTLRLSATALIITGIAIIYLT